jgi:hypothetical protein
MKLKGDKITFNRDSILDFTTYRKRPLLTHEELDILHKKPKRHESRLNF